MRGCVASLLFLLRKNTPKKTRKKTRKNAQKHKNKNHNTNREQGLVKSNNRNEQQLGVRLLSEIFRTSPDRRRECLYYLALGNYKLGNYGEARRYNDLLLDREPANLQATNLRALVDDKVAKEGLMGVAILSSVGIAVGAIGAFVLARRR